MLREEHRLRVFENRMLRKIRGCKRETLKGSWRKVHHELHLVIIQVTKPWRLRWVGHVAGMGEKRHTCRVSVEKEEGKRLFRMSVRRWEDRY
jgi:hypothetical protein